MSSAALIVALLLAAPAEGASVAASSPTWLQPAVETAARVDRALREHWQRNQITPVAVVDDRGLLRRAWLDLSGRAPSVAELNAALAQSGSERRRQWIVERIESVEFALHFGRVLDSWIQAAATPDEKFLGWLRDALEQRRSWEHIFRAIVAAQGTADADKLAARFLSKRVKNIDQLTSDTARVFFGVDITCARCHDHPLVEDWKQDHYYGLAAFLHRATEQGKNSGVIVDKADGDVTFVRRNGQQQTASLMFLSGRKLEPGAKQNRRELLVSAALDEQRFFSRAAVNRVWAWMFGRGLVHPVDQMHTGNPAAIPTVLDVLADDFARSGYDLRQLVGAIALCRANELSSRVERNPPPVDSFAAYRLKPLTPWQWSMSWVATLSAENDATNQSRAQRRDAFVALEKSAAEFVAALDPIGEGFQASGYQATTVEALYLAHHANIQQRLTPADGNLAARLVALPTLAARVSLAWRTILGREPSGDERQSVERWWSQQTGDDASRLGALIWTLVTSAEFRFNH